MPNLRLYEIAESFYHASYKDLLEEAKESDKKEEFSIPPLDIFYQQFHEQARKMYHNALQNLHINPKKNPRLAASVKDYLYNVLEEESSTSIVDPATHRIDLYKCAEESLKKTRHRVRKVTNDKELEAADKDPEISSNSNRNDKTVSIFQEPNTKEKFTNKLVEDYNLLSSKKAKMDFIKNEILGDDHGLSKTEVKKVAKCIDIYLVYKEFKARVLKDNPDLSKEEIHEMYLKDHPEYDPKKFNEILQFSKSWIITKKLKDEIDTLKLSLEDKNLSQEMRDNINSQISSNLSEIEEYTERY